MHAAAHHSIDSGCDDWPKNRSSGTRCSLAEGSAVRAGSRGRPAAADQDARQELRLRRHSWATVTSLMVVALLWAAYGFGNLSWRGSRDGTVLIVGWILVFYAAL